METNERQGFLVTFFYMDERDNSFDWNYEDKQKIVEYRRKFAKGSVTGDFSIIMQFHKDAQISYGESKHDDMKDNLQAL